MANFSETVKRRDSCRSRVMSVAAPRRRWVALKATYCSGVKSKVPFAGPSRSGLVVPAVLLALEKGEPKL